MPTAKVNGLEIAYNVYGEGRPWVITPGGRFSKDYPGVRPMAQALAELGNKVLIYDRPNTGESELCFEGDNESAMQADTLAALLRHLDFGPTIIIGGSGGARVSLLTALRHRELARALGVWWISGGVYGLMSLAMHYGAGSLTAAWNGGMEAVANLAEWKDAIERRPANRQKILDQDPEVFKATMERWMHTYCFCSGDLVPGTLDADVRKLDIPSLVFRSGKSDFCHTRATSERLAELLPNSRLVEPPWPDTEWNDRAAGMWHGFERWPLLVPVVNDWANEVLSLTVARATVDGLSIAYEVIGEGRPWVVMPGGRLSKDTLGIRELAVALADGGYRALIWDRPNCGESDVCFTGESESTMHADVLARLLEQLDMTGALVSGGSAGARLSLHTAARHPDTIAGMAVWWVSGGVYGFQNLAMLYCSESIRAVWNGGMEAVVELPEWQEVLERNPSNRQRFLDQDAAEFLATMERWMKLGFSACEGELQPGISDGYLQTLATPSLIFRNGASDMNHTRATSDRLAELLPNVQVVDPPWLDTEWIDRRAAGEVGFVRWPRLAAAMLKWADETFA